jgi:glutamate-1-semialdehyde 2,1-aminomutase
VVGNMGCVLPTDQFLQSLRSTTAANGALLIYDEVMTGFRVAHGGAQQLLDITPDLTTLGKIVGGGLPLGAYGGRADIMDHVLPVGKVFQAGTLSGNPIATAAGAAMLRLLKEQSPYERLETMSHRLAEGLTAAATAADLPHTLERVGSMMTLFFHPEKVTSWTVAEHCNTERFAKFFWALIERGVYFPCSQYEALFVSATHSDEDIDTTITAAQEACAEIAN